MSRLETRFTELYEANAPQLFDSIERLLIQSAFAHCQRNQVHTAELLGITRNVLRARLQRLGLLPRRRPGLVRSLASAPLPRDRSFDESFDRPRLPA